MAPTGKRSKFGGPWHNCARCEERYHISQLQWQRGLLLCPECYDTGINPLIGNRETEIARVLSQASTNSTELMPDPKLINPDVGTSGEEDIIF